MPQNEVLITTQMGMDVVLAHPKGFELEDSIIKGCQKNVKTYGGSFEICNDMEEAFEGADFVYPKGMVTKTVCAQPYKQDG